MFVPDDLQAALAHQPAAQESFDSLTEHLQYLHVRFVSEVVEPAVRQTRIQEVIELLKNTDN